ncbi:MAG: hypothetical protein ISS70_25405 [Phycisphaerae bacterium]|nr:hypothetical protein [Phycisphaerae bacterium]
MSAQSGRPGILVFAVGTTLVVFALGSVYKDTAITFGWLPGIDAISHDVYFGDNLDDVNNATGRVPQATIGYRPGPLESGKTYYWRVDEVNDTHPDGPWVGNVWSFKTGDFLVVDGFESYDDIRLYR